MNKVISKKLQVSVVLAFLFVQSLAGFAQKPDIEWVSIPAGTFSMGSPAGEPERFDDESQHQVTVSAFSMSKYEVTFDQYEQFCDATGRTKPFDEGWGRGKNPVINVNWADANAFAEWMSCRLPTEAEWEYAARAGSVTPFNTGNCLGTGQANYNGNYPYTGCREGTLVRRTVAVGGFEPNAWGLHDMHGNVWEWCSDIYDNYPPGAQVDPRGPYSGANRVIRGGSWYCYANYCRSAYRGNHNPELINYGIGIRLVKDN